MPPTCSMQGAGDEDAVALPLAVEPVAVADEVADLEQPVAVGRPADLLEAAGPRTPGRSRPPPPRAADPARRTTAVAVTTAGAYVDSPSIPKRRTPGVSRWAPSIISATAAPVDAAIPRLTACAGDGARVVAEVDVAELGAEAAHELLAEPLVGVGPVLDHDHLVVEILDAPAGSCATASAGCVAPPGACCGRRRRPRGPWSQAPRASSRDRRAASFGRRSPRSAAIRGPAPGGAAPVDPLELLTDAALGAKASTRCRAVGRPGMRRRPRTRRARPCRRARRGPSGPPSGSRQSTLSSATSSIGASASVREGAPCRKTTGRRAGRTGRIPREPC